jgi:hypothetical protein
MPVIAAISKIFDKNKTFGNKFGERYVIYIKQRQKAYEAGYEKLYFQQERNRKNV